VHCGKGCFSKTKSQLYFPAPQPLGLPTIQLNFPTLLEVRVALGIIMEILILEMKEVLFPIWSLEKQVSKEEVAMIK
jgi:hypothetical protein